MTKLAITCLFLSVFAVVVLPSLGASPFSYEHCQSCCQGPTCQLRRPSPCNIYCAAVCIPEFVCDTGYIRDTKNGRCVRPEDCP
ncbi:venom peptide SjAPI-like isoform X2 [Diabrotica virgifera virgifera]|nr:venom peptide SjAPI-like isoform X2 [Diabrotica virgifera virgifera]